MSRHSNDTAVRMGPVTVFTLLIIIALATLSVLSLTTAQAARTAAEKHDSAIQALYENEREAQTFLADLDAALAEQRAEGANPNQAARAIANLPFSQQITANENSLTTVFEHASRRLTVMLKLHDDLTYQITSWKTDSTMDTSEQTTLWQGNTGA